MQTKKGGRKRQDLTGMRFARLTVIEYESSKSYGAVMWRCVCDCGKEVVRKAAALRNGRSQSCGCHLGISDRTKDSAYRCWYAMNHRCCNQNDIAYRLYGGRGVSVCEQWRGPGGFERFIEHIGPRPSVEHSIDRFPNCNGNYEPGNVRWATQLQQSRNRRVNRVLELNGERRCVAEWAEIAGMNPSTLGGRLNKMGLAEAMSIPVDKTKRELNGRFAPMASGN